MASGLPCLGGDTGGVSEIIDHGKTGLLFRCNDAGDLLEKLVSLLDDKILRETLGRNAREKIMAQYESGAVARKMVDYYAGL
jgi:glycosyltransferase involved in cell wall biosynthesis